MTIKQKTHFRKAFNSPYLSSADIVAPTPLTIQCVRLEPDKSKKSQDLFNTAYFVEKEIRPGETLKPMILNVGNSKFMKDVTGSHFIDDWQNIPVVVYVDPGVRFGRDIVEGLRLKKGTPQDALATPEQWACIRDFQRAGKVSDTLAAWLKKRDDNLTTDKANQVIAKLQEAENGPAV